MYLHVPCIAGKHRLSFAGPDGFPFFIRSCGTRRCDRVRPDQLRSHVIPLHDRENFPIQSVWKIVSGLTLSRSRPLARLTHAPGAMPCVNSSPVSARRPAACARTFCPTSLQSTSRICMPECDRKGDGGHILSFPSRSSRHHRFSR